MFNMFVNNSESCEAILVIGLALQPLIFVICIITESMCIQRELTIYF